MGGIVIVLIVQTQVRTMPLSLDLPYTSCYLANRRKIADLDMLRRKILRYLYFKTSNAFMAQVFILSYLLQAMLSKKTVEANDESNPCIEISDIKYDIFMVRH